MLLCYVIPAVRIFTCKIYFIYQERSPVLSLQQYAVCSSHQLHLEISGMHASSLQDPLLAKLTTDDLSQQELRRWSQRVEEVLTVCLVATDWDVLCQPHKDCIKAKNKCVTALKFCVDNNIPTRSVRWFSKSNPWIPNDGENIELYIKQFTVKITKRKKIAYRKKLEGKQIQGGGDQG